MSRLATPIHRLQPTKLVDASDRRAIPLMEKPPGRWRSLTVIYRLLRLFSGNLFLRPLGSGTASLRRKRTLHCLQNLGMLWIRAAQTVMLRGGRLSSSFGRELLDLNDRGGAYPFEAIQSIVSESLGRPLSDVFDLFDPHPFTATTVFQLHHARLRREGVRVAVKVQKPYAEAMFNRDLRLFGRAFTLFRALGVRRGMRWADLFHELREIKVHELNYYYEANALGTLDRNLAGQPVHAPRVFRRYTRRRILVMEFITGAFLSDVIALKTEDPERLNHWLETNNICFKTVANRLFNAAYRQVFEDNFFHGDLNRRNIILLRNSHIAIVDCRSVGSLDLESLEKQRLLLQAFADGEYATAAEIYFLLSSRLPRVNLSRVKEELIRHWRIWETRTPIRDLPYEQKSLTYMNGVINRILGDARFAALWSFSKLTGAWVHLDNALAELDPSLDYLKRLRFYFQEAQRRDTVDRIVRLPERLARSVAALHEIPQRISHYNLFEEILIRREAQVLQGSASKMDAVIAAVFAMGGVVGLAVSGFLFLVCLMQRGIYDPLPLLGAQLTRLARGLPVLDLPSWSVLLALAMFVSLFCRRLKKRFKRQEFGRGESASTRP
ncbi:MAG: AarF/ABC1/UbiB kinase family protein [Desulfobacterales bacterium]|nr:AarF/ABC1/UbiB kinase family protein [Desulfobacterales bacterium]